LVSLTEIDRPPPVLASLSTETDHPPRFGLSVNRNRSPPLRFWPLSVHINRSPPARCLSMLIEIAPLFCLNVHRNRPPTILPLSVHSYLPPGFVSLFGY